MLNLFKNFANDESGAVTVDWVVLTAGIVVLGVFVMQTIGASVEGLASDIATEVAATPIGGSSAAPAVP
jgi:Flp pilus assembly pilin Flp